MTASLDDLLRVAEEGARKNLLVHRVRQLLPVFMTDNGVVIGLQMGNDLEKQVGLLAVKAKLKEVGARAYAFVGEMWLSTAAADRPGTRAAESPDRREVVLVGATDGDEVKVRIIPIVRDGVTRKVRELGPAEDVETIRHRFLDLLDD